LNGFKGQWSIFFVFKSTGSGISQRLAWRSATPTNWSKCERSEDTQVLPPVLRDIWVGVLQPHFMPKKRSRHAIVEPVGKVKNAVKNGEFKRI
jgi:hypothetical protein